MNQVEKMLGALRARGLRGFCVFDQGGTSAPYVAASLDKNGQPCDPRNFDPQPTGEAAIADLARRLGVE